LLEVPSVQYHFALGTKPDAIVMCINCHDEEAAKVMNKNRKQVENLLFRAKTCLKTTLIKEDFPL